ncbi:hypothetical protein A5881_000536 [Enterococcus termitis]|nr:hypothetical protein A5881_000743 [Enterococcus termitis]
MPIKSIIGLLLLLSLALNFFIRTIHFFYKSNNIAFSKDTLHTFICESCNVTYKLNGPNTKKKIKFAPTKKIDSLGKSKTTYKFNCPECGKYAYQEKIFDLNINKGLGMIRLKADHEQVEIFKIFFVKCLLPTLVGAMIVSFLF